MRKEKCQEVMTYALNVKVAGQESRQKPQTRQGRPHLPQSRQKKVDKRWIT